MLNIPIYVYIIFLVLVFFIHYAIKAHWPIMESNVAKIVIMVLSGMIPGISIGRSLNYLFKFIRA